MGTFLVNPPHFLSNQNLVPGGRPVCKSEMVEKYICYALLFFAQIIEKKWLNPSTTLMVISNTYALLVNPYQSVEVSPPHHNGPAISAS